MPDVPESSLQDVVAYIKASAAFSFEKWTALADDPKTRIESEYWRGAMNTEHQILNAIEDGSVRDGFT